MFNAFTFPATQGCDTYFPWHHWIPFGSFESMLALSHQSHSSIYFRLNLFCFPRMPINSTLTFLSSFQVIYSCQLTSICPSIECVEDPCGHMQNLQTLFRQHWRSALNSGHWKWEAVALPAAPLPTEYLRLRYIFPCIKGMKHMHGVSWTSLRASSLYFFSWRA